MSARAVIATLIALLALFAGAALILALRGADAGDLVALLAGREGGALCRFLAWAAIALGALTLIAAFAAFFEREDEDGWRRRGAPYVAPFLLFAVALGVFWLALACAFSALDDEPAFDAQAALAGAGVVAEPEPEPEPEPEIVVAEPPPPPPPPPVRVAETALVWPYMYPLVRDGAAVSSPETERALDSFFPTADAEGPRAALCGKAWVALTGSASEEGPLERNLIRARLRAEMAARRAALWLDRHGADCPRPTLLALDLGQHVATGAEDAARGRATGHQRRAMLVSRDRAFPEERVTAEEAMAELDAFLRMHPDALPGGLAWRTEPEVMALQDRY